MPKTEITPVYSAALTDFVNMLNAEYAGTGKVFLSESGRVYDKVKVAEGINDENKKTVFFVEREVGTIYGRKSELAPNMKWYFGDLFTTDDWEWTLPMATPKDQTKFVKVSSYGKDKYVHWRPVGDVTVVVPTPVANEVPVPVSE